MKCPDCGTENEDWSTTCVKCKRSLELQATMFDAPGTMPAPEEPAGEPTPATVPGSPASGRGTLILVFGILGIVLVPFLGIAAWIMGRRDLKRIADGEISPEEEAHTKVGMVLGMVGTGLSALGAIAVLAGILISISFVNDSAVAANRIALTAELNQLARRAQDYYRHQGAVSGKKGTFTGLDMRDLASVATREYATENGTYSIEAGSFGQGPVRLVGIGKQKNGDGEEIRLVMAVWPDSASIIEHN